MLLAAFRPSPMARMTVAPPRTISPPAKMQGMLVCMPSFTTIVFLRPNSKPWMEVGTIGLGGYAHGYDGHVDVQRFRGARYRFRTAATAGIRFAQLHLLQDHLLHRALFVGYVFQRVVQGEELDTFFLGVLHLFEAAGISASERR